MLAGIGIVIAIAVVAGGIAYIGDRVGHQVGRKRLTMFGLRPKYTSTIVAVVTGMLIALSVTLAALVGSSAVRTAFFRIGQLNARINDLQAQALAKEKEIETTRQASLVLPIGYPIADGELTIRPSQPDLVLLPELRTFFDQTVGEANGKFARGQRALLRPYPLKASDPTVETKLRAELQKIRDDITLLPPDTPVLLLPVVGQNLFRGDVISFAFQHYVDNRIAAAGDVLASDDVQGGQRLPLLTLQRLASRASGEMVRRGLPGAFAPNIVVTASAQDVLGSLERLRGHYRLVAKAGADLYPHSGVILLDFSLVPR